MSFNKTADFIQSVQYERNKKWKLNQTQTQTQTQTTNTKHKHKHKHKQQTNTNTNTNINHCNCLQKIAFIELSIMGNINQTVSQRRGEEKSMAIKVRIDCVWMNI